MNQIETTNRPDSVTLHDLHAASEPLAEAEFHQLDNAGETDSSARWTSNDRKRVSVLIGSALSQLPIWGFAVSYGVFQQYYISTLPVHGPSSLYGVIGTTSNGVMYLSMPILFTLFTRRWARFRQLGALCGTGLACLSFILSSLSSQVWHLVITQGILAAFGNALAFSTLTLSLGEWFNSNNPNDRSNRVCNRAVAYSICLSTKNVVGTTCPFLFSALLDKLGFRDALRIWVGILGVTGALSIYLIPNPDNGSSSSATDPAANRTRKIPWSFLRHRTIYIYTIATLLQSAGYGIPQTYLTTYARTISNLPSTFSTLLIALINIPGIASSSVFGFLSDSRSASPSLRLAPTTIISISTLASAASAFLLWGLAGEGDSGIALLTLFALTFGFFASGYSATWGGVLDEMEREARDRNEALDTGVVYGLLNGARGMGFVGGGLVSVPLLAAGSEAQLQGKGSGYDTVYGPLILFTGAALAASGWGAAWKVDWKRLGGLVRMV